MKRIDFDNQFEDKPFLKRKAYLSFSYYAKSSVMKTHHPQIRRELAWITLCTILLFPSFELYALDLRFSLNKIFKIADTLSQEDSLSITIKVDQLKTAYYLKQQKKDDSLKYIGYSKIAFQLARYSDTTLFKKVALDAWELAITLGDDKFIADAHWNYGSYYLNQKEYDSSYYHYDRAYKIFSTNKNYYYAGKMLYNLAYISSQINDFTGAEILLFNAIENFETAFKPKQLYLSYNQLGAIADNLEEYEKAKKYYSKAAGFIPLLSDPPYHQAELWNNMGIMHQKTLNYARALEYFNKALDLDQVLIKRPSLYAKLLDNKAFTLFLLEKRESFLPPMLLAMKIRDSLGDIPGAVISRIHLAKVYTERGDTLKAIAQAKHALELAIASELNRDVLKTLEILSFLEPSNSLAYLRHHVELTKKLNGKERNTRDKFTAIRYETQQYMNENERLFRERTWIIALAAAMLLLLVLIYWNTRQRAKNKELLFEREQQQNNEDMFLLTLENKTTLERGRNLERLRISEELHDGILARLFSIRFKWSFIELTGSAPNLHQHQESIEQLASIEGDIRDISHNLRNELIWNESKFLEEIENNIRERCEAVGLHYIFRSDNIMIWEALDYLEKANISRIMDEILHNVIRHANATQITIAFEAKNDLLNISVSDNGKGFKVNAAHKGIGLRNLKSRVKKLNGELTLTSIIGNGTSINIDLPLKL